MSLEAAEALWGAEAVRLALRDAGAEETTAELATEIGQRADPPGAFRAWALAQPWPRFCAIVRVVAGTVREETMKHGPR
jgi:hypothetical protein